jgi:hypothetical protein
MSLCVRMNPKPGGQNQLDVSRTDGDDSDSAELTA